MHLQLNLHLCSKVDHRLTCYYMILQYFMIAVRDREPRVKRSPEAKEWELRAKVLKV